jgi:DNA-binding transcriptional ArsR family regulator
MKKGMNEVCYGFFSSLANPTRLAIIERLRDGEMNVSGLAAELGLEQSMVSHNIKLLENCGIVTSKRRGKEKYVTSNRDTVDALFRIVERHAERCCALKGGCGRC